MPRNYEELQADSKNYQKLQSDFWVKLSFCGFLGAFGAFGLVIAERRKNSSYKELQELQKFKTIIINNLSNI